MANQSQYSQMPQIPMSKLLPAAILGIVGLAAAGGIVGAWALNIMDLSFRTEGRYAKMLSVPAPPAQLPKDSYVCPADKKDPWLGCSVR